ncbi:SapC family protein [Pseudoduganella sp. LjRoot289]|uniref:SapC family protein n=1 Tax=Pseudoduganella sp. LjRoot289 TaxID=3342314 RepID=UPI003ECDA0A8
MSNPVLLRNVEHKDLKIMPGRGTRFGDGEMMSPTFPAEFRNVLAHYPIVFRETGNAQRYEPVALFGFQGGENLFATADAWDALYVPMAVARQPFLMGLSGDSLLVHVDLDHPKVSTTIGEPLFLEFGGQSDFLEDINSTLLALHQGLQSNAGFVAALLEYELIEPFTLDIELNDGSHNQLAGFSTINEEKLAALDGAALERLHQPGHLMAAYLIVASLTKLRELIERKNQVAAVHG